MSKTNDRTISSFSSVFHKLVEIKDGSSNSSSNGSWYPANLMPFCLKIQTKTLDNVISYWDLFLLVPNAFFVVFLLYQWLRNRRKIKNINFPILTIFFNLILLVALLMIIRCVVTIYVKPVTRVGELVNKVVWLIVRFGQLSTELSVVFFGLFFAKLDSRGSIVRIMYLTMPIALIYIIVQGTMEIFLPDKHYIVQDQNHYYDLYGHGGMIFWFASSASFFLIYMTICILPYTSIRNHFPIPTKRSFYIYCFTLAVLCLVESIGSVLTYANIGDDSMCILDFTTLIYFTMFGPFVYVIFLRKFFQRESLFSSSYFKPNESLAINSNLSDSMVTTMGFNNNTPIQTTLKSPSLIAAADSLISSLANRNNRLFDASVSQSQHSTNNSNSYLRSNNLNDFTETYHPNEDETHPTASSQQIDIHGRQHLSNDYENYMDDDETNVIIIQSPKSFYN